MKTALITQVKVIQSLFIVFFVFAVLAVPAQVHATMLEYMVRENTTDTTAVSTSEAIFGWNSETHASGTAITYSGSKFELETGKYLVLYTQLWETTDATDNTRKEIQGRLDIGGVTATSGASQCYMRKLNGQQECMTSGNAIINVASATTSLETNFYKTDNDSTGIPTRENAGWNGVQVIKLPDAWNYARYALSGAVSANSASTTHADVAWDTTNEEDTGFSRSGANITIANAGRYLVSYSLPMFADGAGTTADRTEYTSRITLDDVEVEGTRVSTMMRTAQEAEDGVLNYIGIIDVGAGEVLAIENLQRAGLTATFQGGSLEIVQLPSAAETFIREATSGDQNTTTLTEFSWDTTAHEDASTFTINSATDSFTEVDVAGDYIFFWSQQSEAAAVSRGNPTARLSVNDTIIDYAGSDEFNRNDTWSYNAGHAHGAFVPGMSATDNVSVENIALATTGTMDVDHGAFSGLRLDSLYEENATTTVSGTLYSDEGSTVIGTGATIKLVVGAGSPVATTTTANGSGVYSFAVDQYLLGMDVPLTVFVDASSSIRAAVVTKATSTSSHISGLDLYQDRVIVRQEGSTSTSVTEFANYDSTDDSDLQFTASVATDEIKILEAQELHIWSGDTFLSPAYLNLTGDFHNNSGVFTHNGGTTTAGLMHAAYVDYKTVTTQESSPREVAFSTDGTKMYVVGSTNDQVVQYTLSPAWDASTASYVHATSVQAYENTPTGLFFKPDGTKMYINGTQNDSVHEYNLSSAWDVSTASYVHATSVAAQESDGHSVQFSTDGSKMFVIGDWGDDVNEYTLSTPWDVSTASFIDSKLVETQDEFPHGLVFARDGYKMFVSGYENDSVYEYTLSTAWDVSTAVLADTFSVGTVVTEPRDINFSADLDKMYIVSTQVGGRVYEYDFSTSSAFTGTLTGASSLGKLVTAGVQTIEFPANASTSEVDVTEGTVLSVSNSLTVTGDLTQNGTFDADGGTLYAAGIGFDLTTASYTNSSSTDEDSAQRGLAFSTDGTNMYITGVTTDKVYEYALSTAWDVSTAAYTHATSVQSQDGTPMGVAFSSDGSTMFVAGNDNNSVYEYTLSTAWDVSTAAYTHATSVSSQDTGPQGVSFSSGGTKMYVVGGTNNTIYSYTLSTPWDVSTAGYDNASLYMGNFDTNPNAAVVSTSGRYLYVAGFDSEQVFVYYLSTLYDISSATYLQTFTPTVSLNAFRDIAFSTSGDEFYTLDFNGVDQYSLRDVQTISGTLIATSSLGDVVISGEQSTYFADNASTTDFTISSGAATVTAPVVLTVAGNFTNSGGDFDHNYGVVELTGTSKTLSGTLTGGSALGSVEVFGSYTASNNASTSHLTIASGGSFVAPSLLTITGEYTNNGTFTNNSGTVYLNGYGNQRFSSYRSIGLSSQTEDTTLKGLTFSPDGLKMFTTGSTNDKVYEYTLGTAWVVATKTYVDGLSVATQTDDPIDVQFSDDGRTMYVLGGSSNSKPEAVNEYSLSTAYDVSTASYTDNFTVTTQDATPTGFRLSRNGTKLFILGDDGDDVNEYLLGTAWDVSTATYVDNYSVATEVTSTDGLFFSVNGDYMYVRGDVGEIHQYTLQVPFDVSTANYQEQVLYSSAFAGYGAWLTYDSSILFTNYSAFDRILTIELNAVHQGTMTGSSVFGSVVFDQTKQTFDVANASTSDLTITASAIVIAPTSTLSVAGDYINEGDFTVSADSVTDIAGAYTNSGTYTAAASSSLRVGGDFSNSGTYTGAGGSNLRVAGNYNNTGTKGIDVTSVFTGSGKTISGTLTSSSRFDEVVITGSYSLLDNATTSDLTITSGGALTATDALTITGSYSNAGTFSHNAGVVIVENNGFDISIASYLHATSVAAQDTVPRDLAFNTTGTKMYVVGSSNDKVYEYDLSSAFDISTASYLHATSVAAQDISPYDVAFNTTGTKMYVVGSSNDKVYEYDLSSAFDISTASYLHATSVAAQDTVPRDLAFNTTGTRMYVIGSSNNKVYEYDLSSAFDISTAAFVSSKDISTEDLFGYGLAFNTTGTKMYMTGSVNDSIYEYVITEEEQTFSGTMTGGSAFNDLVTAGTLPLTFSDNASTTDFTIGSGTATVTAPTLLTVAGDLTNSGGDFDNNSGTIYLTGSSKTISGTLVGDDQLSDVVVTGSYTASNNATTSDLTIASGGSFTAPAAGLLTIDGVYTNSGTFDNNSGTTYFTGADYFDISSASYVHATSVAAQASLSFGLAFSDDGLKLFSVDYVGQEINTYSLSTAWDISTASFVASKSVSAQDTAPTGLTFSDDGMKLFVAGDTGNDINEYTLDAAFDVSNASFVDSKSVSAQDSQPTDVTFSSDGLKMFVMGYNTRKVYEYILDTAFDVSTANYATLYNVFSYQLAPAGLAFSNDGHKMFVAGNNGDDVDEFTLTTPWSVATAVHVDTFSFSTEETYAYGFAFSTDGSRMYITGDGSDAVHEYHLPATHSGAMIGISAFGDVIVADNVQVFQTSASTTDFSILSGAIVHASGTTLDIDGDYTNNGIFTASTSEVLLSGSSQQTATGTLSGASAFNDLTVYNTSGTGATQSIVFGAPVTTTGTFTMAASTSAQFLAGATSTFNTVVWQGAEDSHVWLASTEADTQWYLDVQSIPMTVEFVTASDSNASSSTYGPIPAFNSIDGGNNSNWNFNAEYGSTTIADHDATQVENAFDFQSKTDEALFAFKLTPESGTATVTELVVTLSGAKKIDTADFSNIRLLKDHDNDGVYDATDEQVGGAGVMSISGFSGGITFSTDWLATTTDNYIVVADWSVPDSGSSLNFELFTSGVSMEDYVGSYTVSGSVNQAQHHRINKGGGGSAAAIGDPAPEGRSEETGGTNEGGELIGDDPNYFWPTAHSGDWTNGAYAYDKVDGTYASTDTTNASSSYTGHGFSVPSGNTITGIEVKMEISGTTAAGDIDVELSYDGGSNWTSAKTTPTLTGTDAVVTLGGASDTWGRSWTYAEFNNANFAVRVIGQPSSNTVQIDAIQVRVYHQSTGGGAGGGGAI